jgi:glycosyltransferase involved in cell wall biosynthesis
MGSYSYRPNREAIDFLVSSVMPKVIQHCPEAQVVILGGAVPYQEAWLINPGCVTHGEITIFAEACKVGVAPIFTGSGTRLKILEYMAAGMPVVATAKGAEGLLVQNGRDIFIENGAGSFADRITSLLKDRRLADRIGGRGREVVNTHYSWKSLSRVLLAAGNSSKGRS